jgi:hypothetical protein
MRLQDELEQFECFQSERISSCFQFLSKCFRFLFLIWRAASLLNLHLLAKIRILIIYYNEWEKERIIMSIIPRGNLRKRTKLNCLKENIPRRNSFGYGN